MRKGKKYVWILIVERFYWISFDDLQYSFARQMLHFQLVITYGPNSRIRYHVLRSIWDINEFIIQCLFTRVRVIVPGPTTMKSTMFDWNFKNALSESRAYLYVKNKRTRISSKVILQFPERRGRAESVTVSYIFKNDIQIMTGKFIRLSQFRERKFCQLDVLQLRYSISLY